jgi:hypothetical protein
MDKSEAIACASRRLSSRLAGWWTQKNNRKKERQGGGDAQGVADPHPPKKMDKIQLQNICKYHTYVYIYIHCNFFLPITYSCTC